MNDQGEQESQGRGWGAAKPPEDRTTRLATFPRTGKDAVPEEVRVGIDEFQGKKYVSVRLWRAGVGGFWPTAKGCSIRRSELAGMISALKRADQELNGKAQAPDRGGRRGGGAGVGDRAERQRAAFAMMPPPSTRQFDEFEGQG